MSFGLKEPEGNAPRPSTAGQAHSRVSSNSSNGSKSGIMIPRVPRKNGYGGFGPPRADNDSRRDSLVPEQRSQTLPLPSGSQEPSLRRPSEPGPAPSARMRGPSNEIYGSSPLDLGRSPSLSPSRPRKTSFSGPDLSRPLPPRGTSLLRPKNASDAPPASANVNLAAEFGIGNPYHTPTESQSSNTSAFSEGSKNSSRSSPPSAASARSTRRPSDTKKMDVLMSEVQSSMMDLQPKELTSGFSLSREKPQYAQPMASTRSLDPSLMSPESPMDPAIQGMRPSPVPSRNPARSQAPLEEKPTRRPSRPTTSKGDCKGCGEPIKGKSVSSADGRLTGRYHKQCFVCTTCSEPFQTATFYVIKDAPYCERHYHKLNGSVCTTCDKGIEGQYLETERKQKFHADCLTCFDCYRTLRNDYFEMDGHVYCERDAFRRAQRGRFLGPGDGPSNKMERRTTRMMNM